MIVIYSAQGLRDFARYLDNLIDGENSLFDSQNAFAQRCGLPANTIKAIRSNRNLTPLRFEDGDYHKPTLETILAIAPHIPDPKNNKPFDPDGKPCRLEAICRGWDMLFP